MGDEGAAAGTGSFTDPNGTEPRVAEAAARALDKRLREESGEGGSRGSA